MILLKIDNQSIIKIWLLLFLSAPYLLHAGDTLKIGVHIGPPFILKTEENKYKGLCIDLWEDLADELDLAYEYIPYNDDISIIRALDYGEIDLTINPMNVSASRLEKFAVTQPFFISSIGVATSTVSQSTFRKFLRNFFSIQFFQVVLLLLFIIFCFGTLLWLVERKHNQFQFRPGLIGLLDGLWWSAVTMTTVGYGDKAPKTNAGRAIAILWMFTAIVIISSFTATIASTLTVSTLETNVESLEDLRTLDNTGTVGASSGEDFLILNHFDTYRSYGNPTQALQALVRKDVEVVVFDKTILKYLINYHQLENRILLLPVTFNKQYRSFILPKDSPLFNTINPLLVQRINQASWQEVLRRYNLGEEN